MTDGVDLRDMSTTVNANTNVNTGEFFLIIGESRTSMLSGNDVRDALLVTYLAQQQNRLLQFVLQDFWLDVLQRTAVDADQSMATFAVSHSGRGFLFKIDNKSISD